MTLLIVTIAHFTTMENPLQSFFFLIKELLLLSWPHTENICVPHRQLEQEQLDSSLIKSCYDTDKIAWKLVTVRPDWQTWVVVAFYLFIFWFERLVLRFSLLREGWFWKLWFRKINGVSVLFAESWRPALYSLQNIPGCVGVYPTRLCFVGLKKAFDHILQAVLWGLLWQYRRLEPLLWAIQSLYISSWSLVHSFPLWLLQYPLSLYGLKFYTQPMSWGCQIRSS